MSKGFSLGINCQKMDAALITTAKGNRALLLKVDGQSVVEKEGKAYINLTVWTNDESDEYGNHLSVQANISRERRENGEKPPYIGNGKQFYPAAENSAPTTDSKSNPVAEVVENDDLPF